MQDKIIGQQEVPTLYVFIIILFYVVTQFNE